MRVTRHEGANLGTPRSLRRRHPFGVQFPSATCSGDMYEIVPTTVPGLVRCYSPIV